VDGGGSGTGGNQVTPTRVTALRIEFVQHGAVRATLTVRTPATPLVPLDAHPPAAGRK
jgi:hypothetical protein